MTSSNNNVNNLVNQIIFPPDMELRKIRKRKKRNNAKKKAKEALKDALKEYDTALDNAKQERVNLPQQLGVLPTALPQINSIREMNNLADDLRERVQQINNLIQEKRDEPTPEELRLIRLRKFMKIPEGSVSEEIPPQLTPPPAGLVPVPSISALTADQTSEIDKIETEIMESQNPAERVKLEARLKMLERARKFRQMREKEEQEKEQKQTEIAEAFADPELFIKTNLQVDMTGRDTGMITVPKGFDDLWNRTRMFLESLNFNFTQGFQGMGQYRLSSRDFENLKTDREQLRNDLNSFLEGLNPFQRQYMDGQILQSESVIPIQLLKEIRRILNTDFKTLFIEYLRSQNQRADPQGIFIGAEKSPFEEQAQQVGLASPDEEKKRQEYIKGLFDIRSELTRDKIELDKIRKLKKEGKADPGYISNLLNDLIQKLNSAETELVRLRAEQDDEVRMTAESDYQEAMREYLKMIKSAQRLLPEAQAEAVPPPEPTEMQQLENAVSQLNDYINDPNLTFDRRYKEAIKLLLEKSQNENLKKRWKDKDTTRGRPGNIKFINDIFDAIKNNDPSLWEQIKSKKSPPKQQRVTFSKLQAGKKPPPGSTS